MKGKRRETFAVVLAPLIIARSAPRRKEPGWQPRQAGLTPPDPGSWNQFHTSSARGPHPCRQGKQNPPRSGGTTAEVPPSRCSVPLPGPATLHSQELIAGPNVSYLHNPGLLRTIDPEAITAAGPPPGALMHGPTIPSLTVLTMRPRRDCGSCCTRVRASLARTAASGRWRPMSPMRRV